MSWSQRQRCQHGQRQSWLEKKLRRPKPGRAVHWRDRRRSRVAEATSRADVLGGQLAEATERSVEPSARAGFPEETLAAMAQAWCRQVPSRWRSSDRVAVRGSDSAEGGVDAEGAATPPPHRCLTLQEQFIL
jgi:hypothetical protein